MTFVAYLKKTMSNLNFTQSDKLQTFLDAVLLDMAIHREKNFFQNSEEKNLFIGFIIHSDRKNHLIVSVERIKTSSSRCLISLEMMESGDPDLLFRRFRIISLAF